MIKYQLPHTRFDQIRDHKQRAIYKIFSLQLCPNVVVQPAAGKNFYCRLTVEKIHMFAVFTDKLLQPYGCSGTNFLRLLSTVQVQKLKCKVKA